MQIILDRPRNMRFSFNSLAWLQVELGHSDQPANDFITWFLGQFQGPEETTRVPGFPILRAVLWACLRSEDKSLTIDQVGDLIKSSETPLIYEKCLQAMVEFFPQKEGTDLPLSQGSPSANGGPSVATTLNLTTGTLTT